MRFSQYNLDELIGIADQQGPNLDDASARELIKEMADRLAACKVRIAKLEELPRALEGPELARAEVNQT